MDTGATTTAECKDLPILVMEDDENDVLLLKRAFKKLNLTCPMHRVRDGEEGMDYLVGTGKFSNREEFPYPAVVLMDLKMPKKSGFEVLKWLRDHPKCRVTPVIVLSSSAQEDDVKRAYELGANTYFLKPHDFTDLLELLAMLRNYWLKAQRPPAAPC